MFGYAVYQLLCVSSSCCIAFKSYMSHIHIINLNQLDKMLFSSCIDLHYKLITDNQQNRNPRARQVISGLLLYKAWPLFMASSTESKLTMHK